MQRGCGTCEPRRRNKCKSAWLCALLAAHHDSSFFDDLPATLRGKVARSQTRPCVARSELGQVRPAFDRA